MNQPIDIRDVITGQAVEIHMLKQAQQQLSEENSRLTRQIKLEIAKNTPAKPPDHMPDEHIIGSPTRPILLNDRAAHSIEPVHLDADHVGPLEHGGEA